MPHAQLQPPARKSDEQVIQAWVTKYCTDHDHHSELESYSPSKLSTFKSLLEGFARAKLREGEWKVNSNRDGLEVTGTNKGANPDDSVETIRTNSIQGVGRNNIQTIRERAINDYLNPRNHLGPDYVLKYILPYGWNSSANFGLDQDTYGKLTQDANATMTLIRTNKARILEILGSSITIDEKRTQILGLISPAPAVTVKPLTVTSEQQYVAGTEVTLTLMSGQEKVPKDTPFTLVNSGGTPFATGKVDENGQVKLTLPQAAGKYTLKIDSYSDSTIEVKQAASAPTRVLTATVTLPEGVQTGKEFQISIKGPDGEAVPDNTEVQLAGTGGPLIAKTKDGIAKFTVQAAGDFVLAIKGYTIPVTTVTVTQAAPTPAVTTNQITNPTINAQNQEILTTLQTQLGGLGVTGFQFDTNVHTISWSTLPQDIMTREQLEKIVSILLTPYSSSSSSHIPLSSAQPVQDAKSQEVAIRVAFAIALSQDDNTKSYLSNVSAIQLAFTGNNLGGVNLNGQINAERADQIATVLQSVALKYKPQVSAPAELKTLAQDKTEAQAGTVLTLTSTESIPQGTTGTSTIKGGQSSPITLNISGNTLTLTLPSQPGEYTININGYKSLTIKVTSAIPVATVTVPEVHETDTPFIIQVKGPNGTNVPDNTEVTLTQQGKAPITVKTTRGTATFTIHDPGGYALAVNKYNIQETRLTVTQKAPVAPTTRFDLETEFASAKRRIDENQEGYVKIPYPNYQGTQIDQLQTRFESQHYLAVRQGTDLIILKADKYAEYIFQHSKQTLDTGAGIVGMELAKLEFVSTLAAKINEKHQFEGYLASGTTKEGMPHLIIININRTADSAISQSQATLDSGHSVHIPEPTRDIASALISRINQVYGTKYTAQLSEQSGQFFIQIKALSTAPAELKSYDTGNMDIKWRKIDGPEGNEQALNTAIRSWFSKTYKDAVLQNISFDGTRIKISYQANQRLKIDQDALRQTVQTALAQEEQTIHMPIPEKAMLTNTNQDMVRQYILQAFRDKFKPTEANVTISAGQVTLKFKSAQQIQENRGNSRSATESSSLILSYITPTNSRTQQFTLTNTGIRKENEADYQRILVAAFNLTENQIHVVGEGKLTIDYNIYTFNQTGAPSQAALLHATFSIDHWTETTAIQARAPTFNLPRLGGWIPHPGLSMPQQQTVTFTPKINPDSITALLNLTVTPQVTNQQANVNPSSTQSIVGNTLILTITQNGAPLKGLNVTITAPDGSITTVTTNSKGEISLEGKKEGKYSISAQGYDFNLKTFIFSKPLSERPSSTVTFNLQAAVTDIRSELSSSENKTGEVKRTYGSEAEAQQVAQSFKTASDAADFFVSVKGNILYAVHVPKMASSLLDKYDLRDSGVRNYAKIYGRDGTKLAGQLASYINANLSERPGMYMGRTVPFGHSATASEGGILTITYKLTKQEVEVLNQSLGSSQTVRISYYLGSGDTKDLKLMQNLDITGDYSQVLRALNGILAKYGLGASTGSDTTGAYVSLRRTILR